MSREDHQMKIRLPAALRDQIAAAAETGKRSLNAEIVARLEQTFAVPVEHLQAEITFLRQQIEERALFNEKLEGDLSLRIQQVKGLKAEVDALKYGPSGHAPDPLEVTVMLDTNGLPLSWDEIRAHASGISKAIGGDPWSMSMKIMTPAVESSHDRQKQTAVVETFYKDARKPKRALDLRTDEERAREATKRK